MATVGQALTAPEAGWKRYDDRDNEFVYNKNKEEQSHPSYYGGSIAYLNYIYNEDFVSFKFKGTKLRIIASSEASQSNRMGITIDGQTYYYSANASPGAFQTLVYEINSLTDEIHIVSIQNNTTNTNFPNATFDAIDIDDTGYLILEGKAILGVTMVDGERKEYEFTKTEVDAFISWYDTRATGTGAPYYTISKSFNIGPFESRTDHLVFDKIQDFEVMAFTE